MRKTLLVLLGFILIFSLVLVACGEEETTAPSVAPPTTAPTTKPPTTAPTTAPTVKPTTPAAPTGEKYGGIYKEAITVGPPRPIGYPPEAAPDSYTAAAPALDRLIGVKLDGTVFGRLATSWKIAEDGKSITLGLRKGVKFHDGSDFNAAVAKWNLDGQIEAKQSIAREWESVDTIDDYTIRLNVKKYTNLLLTGLAGGGTQMISKKTFDEKGVEYCRWHPVGTGPFIFVDYERDNKITYKRNPNYHAAPLPYLDGVEIVVIADATVRKLAFQRGDIFSLAPQSDLDAKELRDSGKYPYRSGSGGGPYVLVPDSMDPKSPWSNVDVRFAASYALDRETLVEGLTFGAAVPAYQMFQTFPNLIVPGLVKTEFDQAKAKKLLADAGYPSGFKTTVHSFIRIVPADYVEAVAAQLRQVGIQVETDFPEAGKYNQLRYGTWDGLMAHGMLAGENANYTLNMYLAGLQFQHCKKPAGWWEGFEASVSSLEPDNQLLQNIIEIMYNDMMIIPYLEKKGIIFRNSGVNEADWGEYNLMTPRYEEVWLDKSLR